MSVTSCLHSPPPPALPPHQTQLAVACLVKVFLMHAGLAVGFKVEITLSHINSIPVSDYVLNKEMVSSLTASYSGPNPCLV